MWYKAYVFLSETPIITPHGAIPFEVKLDNNFFITDWRDDGDEEEVSALQLELLPRE